MGMNKMELMHIYHVCIIFVIPFPACPCPELDYLQTGVKSMTKEELSFIRDPFKVTSNLI